MAKSNKGKPKLELEIAKVAFSAILAEYERVVGEIRTVSGWQKTCIQYSLAIVAGTVTALYYLPTNSIEIFLGAALLLIAIELVFFEQALKMHSMVRYIANNLKPDAEKLLKAIKSSSPRIGRILV